MFVEGGVRVLEHVLHRGQLSGRTVAQAAGQRYAVEVDLAVVRTVQSGQAPAERGLAAAGTADDRHAFAGPDAQGDVAQHVDGMTGTAAVVVGGQVPYFEDGTGLATRFQSCTGAGIGVDFHLRRRVMPGVDPHPRYGAALLPRPEQLARPRMPRPRHHLFHRPRFDHPSALQDHDLVGQLTHHVQVVAEQQDADALPDDRDQLRDDAALGEGVLSGGRFVGDHDAGAQQQGLGEYDALLLAAGQLVRVAAQEFGGVGELGAGERLVDTGCGSPGALAAREVAYLGTGDVGQQGTGPAGGVEDRCRMLRYVADQAVRDRHRPGDPGARRVGAEQGQPGRGLAAAGGADQGGHRSRADPQAHSVDDGPAADLHPQVLDLGDDVRCHAHRRPSFTSATSVTSDGSDRSGMSVTSSTSDASGTSDASDA